METFAFALTLYEVVIRLTGVIGALMVIIFVHEAGHYLVGRWCGIGVSVFSVGFGPELCSFRDKHGTRWRLAVIPLGGYVRFIGNPDAAGTPAAQQQAEDLRLDSFPSASAWKRAATVFAGPFFNAIFTVVVLSALFFAFGQIIIMPVVTDVLPDSPAAQAGFRPGDKFLTMQRAPVSSFDEIPRYVITHEGEPVHFTLDREGRLLEKTVTPHVERVDDGFGNIIRVGRIGIVGSNNPENARRVDYNALESVGHGVRESAYIVWQTVQFIGKLVQGRGDRCQLSGPVRSAQIAWKVSDFGFLALLQLATFFSISVGIFNLLPVPPLDGGHLIFYLLEGVAGRPVSPHIQEFFFRVGLAVVLLFIVFAILNNYVPC